uniref:FAD-binding domain-containing protein n=1 Tax=Grammatophora oceanica TaxID=210454 RepID=A0A7S1VRZ4_9STRA
MEDNLPVIIAGAGPCGLVAALTLQQHNIPCRVLERASRAKLCSNAGSGIDMAPTAIHLLENDLQVDLNRAMRPYDYMYIGDMEGGHVATYRLKDMKVTETRPFGFAGRADLQKALLEKLDESILQCGVSVKEFAQQESHVDVMLSDGTTIQGSALLACDGIHSAIRAHMHQDISDELNYCGQECWWGKTTIVPGSELDDALRSLEKERGMDDKDNGGVGFVSLMYLATRKFPGAFFSCPIDDDVHAWAYISKKDTAPVANQSNDLTRRGSAILSDDDKRRELERLVTEGAPLMGLIIQATPASDISRAGFFDRKHLDLPYVQGRVALLGDAAHPQSPMMGQGANMAIVDGYVLAKRLAATKLRNVENTLGEYDSLSRRKANNKVIQDARGYGTTFVSNHPFTCWATKLVIKLMPASVMVSEMIKGDKSNNDFVKSMNEAIKVSE